MHAIALLENPVRDYAWGSRTALARLVGAPTPSPGPEAELWMGAHPSGSSRLRIGGRLVALSDLIAQEPEAILGRRVLERFGPRLPFLVKLLAAAAPLSIQAHPSAEQAREGFAREQALGIPLESVRRNYRDQSHKPELLRALEPTEMLRGFRPPGEILGLADRLGVRRVRDFVAKALGREHALATLCARWLRLDPAACRRLATEAAEAASGSPDASLAWVARLHDLHPGDPGVLAPLLLNHLRLEPGEAVFVAPGELHTYLGGFGVEVMASSDNVLRAGLTSKHVDVEELLRVLRFEPGSGEILRPEPDCSGVVVYPTPAREFELSALRVGPGRASAGGVEDGVQILLCTRGRAQVEAAGSTLELRSGRSCLVPASAGATRVEGDGDLYRVAVPRRP